MTCNNLCIIPARGGSKRIPRKNIREFCGKPMIAWSIEAACASGCFDRIIVSTDDAEIADVSRQWGADVPFMRPPDLADDYATTRSVVIHAIREATKLYGEVNRTCCLYPTAPFVTPDDLRSALQMQQVHQVDFVFSAASFAYPIQRAFRMTASGGLERIQPEHRNTRSQDLEETFHDAGQFYWGLAQAFVNGIDVISPGGRAYVLPRFQVHDIDTIEDWDRAELVFRALRKCEEGQ